MTTDTSGVDILDSEALEVETCPSCDLVAAPGEALFRGRHAGCAALDIAELQEDFATFINSRAFKQGMDLEEMRGLTLGRLILWWESVQEEHRR